jgi:hypothetical protein
MAQNQGRQWRKRRTNKSGSGDGGDDGALYRSMWMELLREAFARRKLKQFARGYRRRRDDGAAQR